MPLPGDAVAVVGVDESRQGHGHDEGDHGEHCHGESSCSDVQPLAISGFVLMSKTLALLGATGVMLA